MSGGYGGREQYKTLLDNYYSYGDGFIMVYSITDRNSFNEINSIYENFLRVKDSDSFPMVLVGNKCDLEKLREVSYDEGKTLASTMNIPFFEVSSKVGGESVTEIFQTLT